jgi:tripartite-type tricarboxylate transporter receptor subunit TctC
MKLKQFIASLAGAAVVTLTSPIHAQQAPLPAVVKIVVPATAGSGTDVLARAVAIQLQARTGSTFIVENKAGASTLLGSAAVAKSPKDGSVLLINSTTLLSAAALMKEPPLNVINDLVPVAMLVQSPILVTVSTKSNIKTPAEFVAAARAAPDTITHGTAGVGSIAHVAQELLGDAAKIKIKHIPYKGASAAVQDLTSGTIDMVMAMNSSVAPGIATGRTRAIAITSAQPNPSFPGVPTMASAVPGFSLDLWVGFFLPSGTPPAIVQRLNKDINEIAKTEKMRALMASDGGVPLAQTPEQISVSMRESFSVFKKLATEKNLIAE